MFAIGVVLILCAALCINWLSPNSSYRFKSDHWIDAVGAASFWIGVVLIICSFVVKLWQWMP